MKKVVEVKPGYQTSEFWMGMISMFMTGGLGLSPNMVDNSMMFAPMFLSAIYTLSRSIVKAFSKGV